MAVKLTRKYLYLLFQHITEIISALSNHSSACLSTTEAKSGMLVVQVSQTTPPPVCPNVMSTDASEQTTALPPGLAEVINMSMLRKALERGLTPANIISYASLQIMTRWGRFWGTLRLRCKAALVGVSIGAGVTAHGPVGLMRWPGSHISIGAETSLISSWRRATAAALATPVRLRTFGPGARIDIGPGAQLSGTSITARSTAISIGRQVLIAPNCIIVDSDFHAHWPPEARATEPGMEGDRPVTIGDYAWIGLNCIILKGVTIGEGAIIGAGSVVTKDVPPHSLAAGSPARVLRSLVSNEDRVAASQSVGQARPAAQTETPPRGDA